METIPFSFDNSKDIPNTELSSYFRTETIKFKSMKKNPDYILSVFEESLKFYKKSFDHFSLNDLIYLIRICWHENPKILWEKFSDQIIKISKENFNGMIITVSISSFTPDMEDSNVSPDSKTFFETFINECFNEINENYENIENVDCEYFTVFNQNLDRKQILFLLFELIQAIPYSEIYIFKYLPFIITKLSTTRVFSLFSFFIANKMIQILPRSIFLDRSFLEYTSVSNSVNLLNEMNEEEFLITYPWYYQKITMNDSNNSELSFCFLRKVSNIDSEEVIVFMKKICSDGKSRIQQLIDNASEFDFSSEDILKLKKYKFRLPENLSKKFDSLDEDNEFLSTISSNPLLYMDRSKLDRILYESENPLVYSNLFRTCDISDYIFKDLEFWSHVIPLFPKINEFNANSLFIQVDRTNVPTRLSLLLLHNYPQNMKPVFFDFAKNILEQTRDFESFLKLEETQALLKNIDNYQPFQFWRLFISIDPILSVINNDYEGHLALTLGVAYLSIYIYEIHSTPPDPKISVFKILEQTEESISELHSIAQNKPDRKTDVSNLSTPAISVVTAANLLTSNVLNKFNEFKIEGLTANIFMPFFSIIVNNLSYFNRNVDNNFIRFHLNRRDFPLNNFINNYECSKQLIEYLKSINFTNLNNDFIEILLNTFIKLSDNITVTCFDLLVKILKVFSDNLLFYLSTDSPNAKLMSQFFAKIFKDLNNHNPNSKKVRSAITSQMQPYIIRLFIQFPCKYSSSYFDNQIIKKVVKEEKESNRFNYNIILFLMNDSNKKESKRKIVSFNSDEITQMVNQTIETNDFKSLRAIIDFEKKLFIDLYVPLLKEKIPIDIKYLILNKLIPFEIIQYEELTSRINETKAREKIQFEVLISIIKETKNLKLFKAKMFPLLFNLLLESPIMIDYFLVLFEKQYDYTPQNEIKYSGSEFSTAFKKSFQIIKSKEKYLIIKRPSSPEFEQPTEFALQFVNMLIDDFIDQPTWQVLITLFFISSNLPFLFLYIDQIENIFENLFKLFTIFEKYQAFPNSQKQAYIKKHKISNPTSNILRHLRNQVGDMFNNPNENEDEYNYDNDNMQSEESDDENDESDIEIKNMRILFSAAYTGIHFLSSLVSIPQITDKFFKWSLKKFPDFSNGEVFSFLAILIPIINRQTAQHVAVSYLIKYDWISLFTNIYQRIERPMNKFSRYILASLLEVTYEYFIKYVCLLSPEAAATCDELTTIDNPFEVSFDYKTQISPNFTPWLSIKKHEFKTNLARSVLGYPFNNHGTNFFPIFGGNPIRPNRPHILQTRRLMINANQERPNTNANENNNDNDNDNENNNNDNENNNDIERPINRFNDHFIGQPFAERRTIHNILGLNNPFFARGMFHINNIRQGLDSLNLERDDDPFNNLSFWSLFHLAEDELSFIRSMIQASRQIEVKYPDNKYLDTDQLFHSQEEHVDISAFTNIKNELAFNQLDQITQAIILRKELNIPTKLSSKMQRYLVTQPQWMTAFITKPPQIVLTPQHIVDVQVVLTKLNEIKDEETEEENKKFYDGFKSSIHTKSREMIDAFLSPKFTISYTSKSGTKKILIYKNLILKCLTGILQVLAANDEDTLKYILDTANNNIKEMNPTHIKQVFQILVPLSALYKCNTSHYFSIELFQRLIKIAGSPEIRLQPNIIEVSARLMVDLTKSFYSERNSSNANIINIYHEIEEGTKQIFSILLNSPNIQTVNKAMKYISSLKDEENIIPFTNPIILSIFNTIFDKFDSGSNEENIKSIASSDSISSFLCIFISKFPELTIQVKDKLLIILRQILQLKDKNVHLIRHIISLYPRRTKIGSIRKNSIKNEKAKLNEGEAKNESNEGEAKNESNEGEAEEDKSDSVSLSNDEVILNDEEVKNEDNLYKGKPILIPMEYYNEWPEFWQVIFDNLSWFQDYVSSHPDALYDTFPFLKEYMELLTFKQKCACFRKELYDKKIYKNKVELRINRNEILKDSFYKLRLSNDRAKSNIRSNIHIKFINEPGFDMGGLTRDWFTSLVKELFNPNYALFKPSENQRSYQPNPSSSINPNHLQYFEFAGLIIARAIIGGICVDAHLTPSFIKQILGVKATLRDLENVDKSLYQSFMWLLENNIDGSDLDIRFTSGFTDIDTAKTVELMPNGENIVVNDDNKKQYVKLYCKHIMKDQIKEQTEAFLTGFNSLITREEISVFTPTELDLLICGVPQIDVEDLKKNCDFSHPYSRNHPAVMMFFDIISKWGHEDLAKLLLFITGSSQVPVGGFKMMKESCQPIIIAPGGEDPRLPQAHTCMNTLDLPQYKDKNVLEEKLLLSISECKNFGFN